MCTNNKNPKVTLCNTVYGEMFATYLFWLISLVKLIRQIIWLYYNVKFGKSANFNMLKICKIMN